MPQPLGLIVDSNQNAAESDPWALILVDPIAGPLVINVIQANDADIKAVQSVYDYSVNLTVQGQNAGVGWSYNPKNDTFSSPPPPPIDWVAVVEDDFDSIATAISQCLSDAMTAGALTPSQLATAYSYSLQDSLSSFSPNQAALMTSIYQYILSGG